MDSVSANPLQNSTKKRSKINRSRPAIAQKIVAFQALTHLEHSRKSAREAASILEIPNSTMQTWRTEKTVKGVLEDEISTFFATPAGSTLLSHIVVAIMYNNKCGASGICGAQESLRHSGLDKYVATSAGALQNFWLRCEECILAFGKQWELKLAEKMKARKITVILDEMFRKRQPCLVAIEAVSNYILFEKFTEDRTAETWKKELEKALKDIPGDATHFRRRKFF